MTDLSLIARNILIVAFNQLEDADYGNFARVYIGNDMILIDEEEFSELKSDILANDNSSIVREKQFSNIVKIKTEE